MPPMLYSFVFGIKAPKFLGLGAGRVRDVLPVPLVFGTCSSFFYLLCFFSSKVFGRIDQHGIQSTDVIEILFLLIYVLF